jgi:mannose-1-phosphate guanylyltransferase
MLHAVIMAGGAGTRFWPLSRTARPKQLLSLAGGQTMLQATAERLAGLVPPKRTWVLTNRSLIAPIQAQLPQLDPQKIVGEPCKRDTAAAIGLAAILVLADDPDATMIVSPSDHLIQPATAFQGALAQAAALVENNPAALVTFGIKPTYPAETFGYIERGGLRGQESEVGGRGLEAGSASAAVYEVSRFREKPARSVAEQYVASGDFYWNSGIFVWKARTVLAALARLEPAMVEHLRTIERYLGQTDFLQVLDREFSAIRGKSIDFAVMEHYQPVLVIEAPFAWDDLGSWQSLARTIGTDDNGNAVLGKHLGIRTSGSIIRSDEEHLIATLGLSDVIVIHTPDATLVANKHEEEAIRELVKLLEDRGWREYL